MRHARLQNELRRLVARGVSASDLTADELDALVTACRRAENPYDGVNADAMGKPVMVCDGVFLWRLTAGASAWLDEFADKWWGRGGRRGGRYFWALVYALVNARNREAFAGLDTEEKAEKAILRCVLRIPATMDEIEYAVDAALGRRPDTRRRGNAIDESVDWSRIAARLEANSGIRAEEWLWGRSTTYAIRAYNDLLRLAAATSGDAAAFERRQDELDDALNALAELRKGIIARVKDGKEGAGADAGGKDGGGNG